MSDVATLERPVARKTPNPNPTVKIDPALLADIRTLAAFHGEHLHEFLGRVLAPIVRKELASMGAELTRRAARERKGHPADPAD